MAFYSLTVYTLYHSDVIKRELIICVNTGSGNGLLPDLYTPNIDKEMHLKPVHF